MTRKDYISIAKAVRPVLTSLIQTKNKAALVPANQMVENLAWELAQTNSRFDREHFLAVVRGDKELNSKPSNGGRS